MSTQRNRLVYVEQPVEHAVTVWYHDREVTDGIPVPLADARVTDDLDPCPGCFPNDGDEHHGARCVDTDHGPMVRYGADR